MTKRGTGLTEKQWSQQVYDLARLLGWRAVRFPTWRRTSTTPGFPDLVMVRRGRLIFAELKREGGKPTPSQLEWLKELGGVKSVEVYTWWPSDFDEVKEVLSGT